MISDFEVWGRLITQGRSSRLSGHKTREEADAELERKSGLKVHFYDGPRPLYSDLTVRPELTAAELAIDWCFPWTMVTP